MSKVKHIFGGVFLGLILPCLSLYGKPITKSVVKNETLSIDLEEYAGEEDLTEVEVLNASTKGKLQLKDDYTIEYQPAFDVCAETDVFKCILRASNSVDTLTFSVEILCEDLTIYSGFSPDGDGENDVFIIKGVENYPNNSLSIFDYSGKEIYRKEGYHNDWDGNPSNEKLIGEYTYFYVFEDGKGNAHSGYFRIDI